jgi:hypothetical protein
MNRYFIVFYRVVTQTEDYSATMSVTTKLPYPSKYGLIDKIKSSSKGAIRIDITNIVSLDCEEYYSWNSK